MMRLSPANSAVGKARAKNKIFQMVRTRLVTEDAATPVSRARTPTMRL